MHGRTGLIEMRLTKKQILEKGGYIPKPGRPGLMDGERSDIVQFKLPVSQIRQLGPKPNAMARQIIQEKLTTEAAI